MPPLIEKICSISPELLQKSSAFEISISLFIAGINFFSILSAKKNILLSSTNLGYYLNKNAFPLCCECVNELLKENNYNDLESLDVSKIKYTYNIAGKEANSKEKRIFIFCTSADNDSLNMWNYYVNNGKYQGYNIGVNINKFLKFADYHGE